MARLTPPMEHALKVLGDGHWHEFEKALYEVSKGVPPNLAVRMAETNRVRQWLKDHPGTTKADVPPRRNGTTQDQLVRAGARHIARTILQNQRFEHVRHKETGHRLVRIFPINAPTPPPAGYEHFLKRQTVYLGKSAEEIKRIRSEKTRKGVQNRLRRQGIDPAEHLTWEEKNRQRKEWWASLTPEERFKFNSEKSKRGWEKRREQEGGPDGSVSDQR